MNSALLKSYPQIVGPDNDLEAKIPEYYRKDIWRFRDSFFDDKVRGNTRIRNRVINFSKFPINPNITLEYKFMLSQRIEKESIAVSTACEYGKGYTRMSEYISLFHPQITSILELDIEREIPRYKAYIGTNGCGSSYAKVTRGSHFRQFHEFISDYYDDRPETSKDIWDVRRIPGSRFNGSTGYYTLSFMRIPLRYKELVKKYMRLRLLQKSSYSCSADIKAFQFFFGYLDREYPDWSDITLLTRKEMEAFLFWFRNNTNGNVSTNNYYLVLIRIFIDYIQRACWKEAPLAHISKIMLPEDIPNRMGRRKERQEQIKYIPQSVLAQLDMHIDKLPKEYYPIARIIRASGWRISDVLNLRYYKCLVQTPQGYYLCGDITKVDVLNHKVPITDEIAGIVQTAIDHAKSKSTKENNPDKYLFTRFRGRRIGLPFCTTYLANALNRLAKNNNIVDENGEIFHFVNHSFRHTKGVELINNGMPLTHVQKWLAHASMEMTLVYAKVFDSTMRKSWEEATKDGLFRMDEHGSLNAVDISNIEDEDLIEWEYIRHNLDAVRMPLGYCMKPKKQECRSQLNPCLTCVNLCTTADFIPQFEVEIEEVKLLIEKGKELGRTIWVEKNQILLEKYIEILAILKKGKTRHQLGKAGREYMAEQRS